MNSKNILRTFQVFLAVALFFANSASAQSSSTPKKNYVYEFNVSGLLSQEQATKMDSALTGHAGIIKWETDYHHKKVKVTSSMYIQFKDLMTVCHVNKCEASEEHTLTEVEEQQ
jgi:hypothetical protein